MFLVFGDNFYSLIVHIKLTFERCFFFQTTQAPILVALISAEVFNIFGVYLFFYHPVYMTAVDKN